MVKMNKTIYKTTIFQILVKKNWVGTHATTRILGEISEQNRATHSDEEENIVFRRSNSTISCKLLSFDAGVNERKLEGGLGCSRALPSEPSCYDMMLSGGRMKLDCVYT
jgi:hypothetical protein